ncbi:hypothetical protein HMI54_003865 [Coelomomyces lativittatus]|nr:hypothetical protein HMI54_003865 [Coelomomyces lativittatus]KAJ1513706.1 hypothetical protein HMI56_001928 [Coelomomyces lativittatus]
MKQKIDDEPESPSYSLEYYGFVMYLLSACSLVIYLCWAILPDSVFHAIGIYYYPDRWWALALPSWTILCFISVIVINTSYMLYKTPSPDSIETITDEFSKIGVCGKGELADLPLGLVNSILYLDDQAIGK